MYRKCLIALYTHSFLPTSSLILEREKQRLSNSGKLNKQSSAFQLAISSWQTLWIIFKRVVMQNQLFFPPQPLLYENGVCERVRTLCYEVPPQQWVEHRFNSIHLLDDKCFSKSDRQLQGCHEVTILQRTGTQTQTHNCNLEFQVGDTVLSNISYQYHYYPQ